METIIDRITGTFASYGGDKYGSEAVTQLQHALQTATLAEIEKAPVHLVVAALLHDIGHILQGRDLPEDDQMDLHDFHEELGYQWLVKHFGEKVAEPVRLHVAAKRYLCTVDKEYESKLSPASRKSYYDQGGEMGPAEKNDFEENAYFADAIILRKWDDRAKDPAFETPEIDHFVAHIQQCLIAQ